MASRRTPSAPATPQGGWSMEDYAIPSKGEALARALIHVREREVARAEKDVAAFLTTFFKEELDAIIADALGSKSVVASLKKWASALVRVTKRFEPKLVAGMSPRIFRTGRKVLWDTAHLLGMKPKDLDPALFKVRADQLARDVVGLARTTRERLASCLAQGVKERLTDKQMVARLRARFPAMTLSRIKTIARTEMGRAADLGQLAAYRMDGRVTHVSVVGCQAIEPGIPEFEGVPTCNIRNVPLKASDQLEFHINHTGMLIPSGFLTRAGNVPRLQLRGGKCSHAYYHKGGPGSGNFGHAGRPGEVGGSGSGGATSHKEDFDPANRKNSARVGDELIRGNMPPTLPGLSPPSSLKKRMVEELTAACDPAALDSALIYEDQHNQKERERIVDETIRQWASSSYDHEADSIAIQHVINEKFGTGVDVINGLPSHMRAEVESALADRGRAYREIVTRMHERTQAMLEEQGITELTVYRGVVVGAENGKDVFPPDAIASGTIGEVNARSYPASSWSTNYDTAFNFAMSPDRNVGDASCIMTARIPAASILSVPTTGFGCLTEREVVAIGGGGKYATQRLRDSTP